MPDRRPASAARRPGASSTPAHPVEGVEARAAALALMQAALARRGGLDDGWGEEAGGLDARDRGLARAVAGAALRHLGLIDRLLAARLAKPPPPAVTDLLRLGAAQLLALRAPAFAAVSTTVELAGRSSATRPFKGLVNAVLRGMDRDGGPALLETLPPKAALPDWLAARWTRGLGRGGRRRAWPPASCGSRRPTSPSATRPTPTALAAELEAERLPGGSLRTARRGDLADWPGYARGPLVGAGRRRRLARPPAGRARRARRRSTSAPRPAARRCSSPPPVPRVTALDRSAGRLARVAQNLARTGLAAEMVTADAATWDDPRTFDAVLLDAPCSATGTFRRHPDVLWATRPGDIGKLAGVQAAPAGRGGAPGAAGRAAGLLHLLARAGGGGGSGRALPGPPRPASACRTRRARLAWRGRRRRAAGASRPAPRSRRRGATASSSRASTTRAEPARSARVQPDGTEAWASSSRRIAAMTAAPRRPLAVVASLALVAALGLSACETYDGPDRYCPYEAGVPARVDEGRVVDFRPVRFGPNGDNAAVGTVGGAVAGGLIGSAVAGRHDGAALGDRAARCSARWRATPSPRGDERPGFAYIVRRRDGSTLEVAQPDPAPIPQRHARLHHLWRAGRASRRSAAMATAPPPPPAPAAARLLSRSRRALRGRGGERYPGAWPLPPPSRPTRPGAR